MPRVLGKSFAHPGDLEPILHPIRGNHFTKGGLEMAVWDLAAKAANLPLWKYLGGIKTDLPVGISVGIKKSPEALAEFVLEQEALGYKRIKLKIGPGRDVAFVAAARAALKPETKLTSDANSAYTLDDIEVLKQLGRLGHAVHGTTTRLRRPGRPCNASKATENPNLPRRTNSQRWRRSQSQTTRFGQRHQPQTWAGGWASRVATHRNVLPGKQD